MDMLHKRRGVCPGMRVRARAATLCAGLQSLPAPARRPAERACTPPPRQQALAAHAHTHKTRASTRGNPAPAQPAARACALPAVKARRRRRRQRGNTLQLRGGGSHCQRLQRSAASGARRHLHHGSKRSRQWAACGGPPVVPLTHAPGLQHAAASASAPAPAPAPAPRSGMLAPDCSTSARGVVFGPERNVVFGFHCEHMRWGAVGRGGS